MKRSFDLAGLANMRARMDEQVGSSRTGGTGGRSGPANKYLSTPVQPEKSLHIFLTQVRQSALNYLPKELSSKLPITTPFCEVEARMGILKVPHAVPGRRVTSSGAKKVSNQTVKAFDCSRHECGMESGVSRTHFSRWTSAGLSEASPVAKALGVDSHDPAVLKRDLVEVEYVETVYTGYAQDARVAFVGYHDTTTQHLNGKMESKDKLLVQDFCLPAAPYDIRIGLSSEKQLTPNIGTQPPAGWKSRRVKRRRSYSRRDKSIAWQIDITEVTTTVAPTFGDASGAATEQVDYEIEMELREAVMLQLVNEADAEKLRKMTSQLAQQLWWVLTQMNPLADALDVEENVQDHPNKKAVQFALASCTALKSFMDGGAIPGTYDSPLRHPNNPPHPRGNFVGCMPINFSRHNLEDIQRGAENAYFLSEKTDGVRYFLIFTGDTAVLVDRAMRGKQPVPVTPGEEPFAPILDLIQPGTILDGEVVMNRRGRKPRPVFIVFDVMAISVSEAILHLPFEQRLAHLKKASFRTKTAARDMFDEKLVLNPKVSLPLVRKNFVKRTGLDDLLAHVMEERGMRIYRNGELHNHLTDGIIFQPNLPYVCGTDHNLLKWKYLDTVTIDVEIQPLRPSDDDDVLRLACLGEDQTRVDMTRYVLLPKSERTKLEADKFESGGSIAEVGFDPETGEWYYLTMRGDKIAPNHISTVLGTLLELAESLTTDELRYRMSVLPGARDTYRKDMRGMLKQLLEHQRRRLQQAQRPDAAKRR